MIIFAKALPEPFSGKKPLVMNESTRQKKVARLLQREIGDILQKDVHYVLGGAFVTVMDVDISPDLGHAKVYISMMLVKDKEKLINQINGKKRDIRGELGKRIGQRMRIVPELNFLVDDLQEKAQRLDHIIDNLDIPPDPESGED